MNAQHDTNDEIILEKLTLLHPVPPRNAFRAAYTRAHFLKSIKHHRQSHGRRPSPNGGPIPRELIQLKEYFMFSRQHFTKYGFIAIILVITLFFGGVWATAAYAQVALPGDALYSVKTGLEDAQVSFSVDAARDANLHLQFADLRLKEMDRLVERGRFDDLGVATAKFEYHIQEAIKSLAAVAVNDPEEARTMAISVNEALAQRIQEKTGIGNRNEKEKF